MNGIILFEFCSDYQRSLFAKEVNKKRLEEINIKNQQLKSKNIDSFFSTSNANYLSRNKVVKDLKEIGDKLFNLLAFEKSDSKINFFVDINSDIQYREKDLFYAEGNATINFSNDTALSVQEVSHVELEDSITVNGRISVYNKSFLDASESSINCSNANSCIFINNSEIELYSMTINATNIQFSVLDLSHGSKGNLDQTNITSDGDTAGVHLQCQLKHRFK